FFFLSSRRRHTRSYGDWSSDVCSSDLDELSYDDSEEPTIGLVPPGVSWDEVRDHIKIVHSPLLVGPESGGQYAGAYWASTQMVRSEERRVGKAWSAEWARETGRDQERK